MESWNKYKSFSDNTAIKDKAVFDMNIKMDESLSEDNHNLDILEIN